MAGRRARLNPIGAAVAVTQWYTPSISFVPNRRVQIGTPPLPVLIVFTLACCAAALAMAWPLILELTQGSRQLCDLPRHVKE